MDGSAATMSYEAPTSGPVYPPALQGQSVTGPARVSQECSQHVNNDSGRHPTTAFHLDNQQLRVHVNNESASAPLGLRDNFQVNGPCYTSANPQTAPKKSRWGARVAVSDNIQSDGCPETDSAISIPVQPNNPNQMSVGTPVAIPLHLAKMEEVTASQDCFDAATSNSDMLRDCRSHALAIAQKFNEDRQQVRNIQGNNRFVYGSLDHQYHISTLPADASLGRNFTETLAAEYATKRNAFWEQFELRKRKATMLNLDFVARREGERARQRLAQLEETRIQEREMTTFHDAIVKSRSNVSKSLRMSSLAGLGTQERQEQEQKRKHVISKASDNSIAIYVAGLSTDEPLSNNSAEGVMRSLFGCYGEIKKIHFYLDKQSGMRKGDALVIYNLRNNNDDTRRALVEMVCSQVRLDIWVQ